MPRARTGTRPGVTPATAETPSLSVLWGARRGLTFPENRFPLFGVMTEDHHVPTSRNGRREARLLRSAPRNEGNAVGALCGQHQTPSARRTAARSASRALRDSWPACGLKRWLAANRQAFWRSRPDVR